MSSIVTHMNLSKHFFILKPLVFQNLCVSLQFIFIYLLQRDYYRSNAATQAAGAHYHSGGGGAAAGRGGKYGKELGASIEDLESSDEENELDKKIRARQEETEEGTGETEEERVARQQREKLRIERRKEREREIRMENMKGKIRQNKMDRDEGRDISEKIALGMHKGGAKLSGEAMYDSRLFNQSAGMDSGFGADDEYNTYSKPLFDQGEAASIYRPKRDDVDMYGDADAQYEKLKNTSKFRPEKGFMGAEEVSAGHHRDGPVQFENARTARRDDDNEHDTKRSRHN